MPFGIPTRAAKAFTKMVGGPVREVRKFVGGNPLPDVGDTVSRFATGSPGYKLPGVNIPNVPTTPIGDIPTTRDLLGGGGGGGSDPASGGGRDTLVMVGLAALAAYVISKG